VEDILSWEWRIIDAAGVRYTCWGKLGLQAPAKYNEVVANNLEGKFVWNGSDKQLRTDRFYAIPHRRRRQIQARQRDPGIPSYPRQP
jgi:hypothetical protein